jgi:predicted unusual protein kinase regulating ubiquinone biosynthesis (AarF/ABC1/UbiB family)
LEVGAVEVRGVTPNNRAVANGRLARSVAPAKLAGRTAARWAASHLAVGARRREKREQFVLRTADDVTRTMGEMKGAVMKVGQVMSMMTGLVPPEMAAQLAALQAEAPPMAYPLVKQVFREEFDATPDRLFAGFDHQPFAAASIGQVHRAQLHDGTPVAVKVQYPGVSQAIRHDLANVGVLISAAGLASRGLDARPIVEDLKSGVSAELDYVRESAWQARFGELYDGHAFVRVPRVYPELSSGRVLVQEYLDGRPIREAFRLPQAERNRIAEAIFRFAFGSFYRHGLFNGDPHPGNYLLLAGGRVGFVDYGCVTEFHAGTIGDFKRVIRALIEGDIEGWRTATEDIGILKRGAPFTTAELYEHMHWFWEPILADEVTFTPELAAEMIRRNTMTTGPGGAINRWCNVPRGMVFLTRINFGLAGLLASLGATGPWRAIVREYVFDDPPSTELGRHSAATSRGPAI